MDIETSRYKMYKRQRRKFAMNVYLLAAFFLIFAAVQWYFIWFFKEARNFLLDNHWFSITMFLLGLFLLTVFIFFEVIRFFKPINWAMAFLIVEGIILGVGLLVIEQTRTELLLQFPIWVIVLAVFIIIGTLLPHDLTLDVVMLFIMAVILLIGAIYFLMLHIVLNVRFSFLVHRIFISIAVILFIMYHAQIINGGRLAEMRIQDYLLGAVILFLDFVILYLFSFFSAKRWSDPCDKYKDLVIFRDFQRYQDLHATEEPPPVLKF